MKVMDLILHSPSRTAREIADCAVERGLSENTTAQSVRVERHRLRQAGHRIETQNGRPRIVGPAVERLRARGLDTGQISERLGLTRATVLAHDRLNRLRAAAVASLPDQA